MDDTFGGVIIGNPEPQTLVLIAQRAVSGFSGYSGAAGTGGGGSGTGASGFSGSSGRSGFSGFSSRSGYSGYSGVGVSGFSGYSGASGVSGQAGGNSGYSGYSGLDGTFSASGFSGYSGFSSRSGFSGYSGSGISGFSGDSGYSGFSGKSGYSAYSGFSGPATSGFSGYSGFSSSSGYSGFSGGPSGFSGYSGAGSPSGGTVGQMQFNDGAAGFSGTPNVVTAAGATNLTAPNVFFRDSSDTTKKLRFELGLLPTATTATVTAPAVNNPVLVAPSAVLANQFVTGIGTTGQVIKAQPDTSDLSGLVSFGQLDRSTTVVAETPTVTITANTKVKTQASGVLNTISFGSSLPNATQGRRLDLDVTGGPYTLTIPTCRRIGETGTISSLQVFAGYQEFSWEYINGEYVMSDSVSDPSSAGGTGSSGFSGFSGLSGRSGYSAFSGYSGAQGPQGISGFSGSGGGGGSGFSGYSAPQSLIFSTHNDTDYTLVIGDANTGVKMASATPHTLTIPTNAAVPFLVGTQIAVEQGGTAVVTIAAAGGVTMQGASATLGQYSVVALVKQGTDTWLVAQSGASGYSGYSGAQGPQGISGFSGSGGGGGSGFSGYSGPGSSGFSGYSAFSGFSGRSGYSGFSGPQNLTFSTQTDTDYTLVLGDANTGIKMSSGSPHTLTIPPNSSVAFPLGTQIPIEQGSSGVVTIAAGVGVTLQGATATTGQYSMVVLIKQGTDTWLASSGNSGYSGYSGFSGFSGKSGYSGFSAFSGFSGSGGFTKLTVAGADATTTDLVNLADITGLVTGTLTPSALYSIHAVLFCSVSATASMAVAIHPGGSGSAGTVNATVSATTTTTSGTTTTIAAADTATTNFLTTPSINGTIEITGWVVARSVTPTISIQFIKTGGGGTATVKIGSYLEYRLA